MPTIALDFAHQAHQRFDRLNQVQIAAVTVRVVLTATLLAMGKGVVALAAVQVVVAAVKLVLLLGGLRTYVPGARLDLRRFDWGVLKPLLKPGGWAVLDNSMRQMASSSDSFILGMFGSVSGVALFGVGSKLPTQVWSMVSRGAIVMLPSLAKHHADQDVAQLRKLYLNAQRLIFTGVLPVVALGCVCARPLMEVWAGERYRGAAVIMQWLLFAALSLSMEYSSDLLLYARGEVKTAARISTAESVANVALSLVLVFRYGAVGLAVGTTLTHILINALWYTPSACRSVEVRISELLKTMLSGNGWAFALLAAEVVLLASVRTRVSAPAMVTLGVIAGMIYMAVWSMRIAIPMRRMRAEAAD
jgi:O-antigen/teichoic acid export membrane protein